MPPSKVSIPLTLEDINLDWIRGALQPKFPDAEITAIEVQDLIRGASTKVRVALQANSGQLPASVIVKGGFEEHSKDMCYGQRMEMRAYRDVLPHVNLDAPACHFAGEDEEGRAVIILEDLTLREMEFLSLLKPLNYNIAAGFLEGLAELHAAWWDSEAVGDDGEFVWAPIADGGGTPRYLNLLAMEETRNHYHSLPRCASISVHLHDWQRVTAAHQRLRKLHSHMPRTLCHGDMHLGNLYLSKGDVPGFLDWHPRRTPWALDVTYFMVAGLDVVDRRQWEASLLTRYLQCLRDKGVKAPNFEEAWMSYRQHVVWGFLIWSFNGSAFQTEPNNTAATSRFGAAMIDLDCFGALSI